MPKVYRGMLADGPLPAVGPTSRKLGVRPGKDIPVTEDGRVLPQTDGLSVAPSLKDLPIHQVPKRLRHLVPDASAPNTNICWSMGQGPFVDEPINERLALRPDLPGHGLIEPRAPTSIEEFQADLAATRDRWHVDEG